MSTLSNRLKCSVHPGLPNPVVRVPFGLESASKAELGLSPAQLRVVVAVVASDFTQVGPVTVKELSQVAECGGSRMFDLERAGWVEVVGTLPRSTSKLYRATAKAWKALGLEGWSLLKEVA